MTTHDLPRGMVRSGVTTGTVEGYMPGFGNDFETEALPGALPQGQNSPQKCAYGLYAEQLSGTAFTAPRGKNERTWCYRIRPSVRHTGAFAPIEVPYWKSAPHIVPDVMSLGQYRWDPVPLPARRGADLVTGMRTMTTAGDVNTQVGMASHIYLVNAARCRTSTSTPPTASSSSCRRRGGCASAPSSAVIDLEPRRSRSSPAAWFTASRCSEGPAAASSARTTGRSSTCPSRGPIGANCLANPRDFKMPGRGLRGPRDRVRASSVKWCGSSTRPEIDHSPLDIVAWHGNYCAYKYDLRTYCAGRRDPLRPPRSVDLHGADRALGRRRGPRTSTSCCSASAGWSPSTRFRPPWYHKNVMSELMGNIYGVYDAKPQGFAPGGMSPAQLHAAARAGPRGLRARLERRAEAREARRDHVASCSRPASRST